MASTRIFDFITVCSSCGGNRAAPLTMPICVQALMAFVKDALKPAWKEKRIDRDSFKLIARKAVDKVMVAAPLEAKRFDDTLHWGPQFLNDTRKVKIQKLVDGYVLKHSQPAFVL